MKVRLDGNYSSIMYGPVRQVLTITRNCENYPVVVEFPDGVLRLYSKEGLCTLDWDDQLIEVCEFKKGEQVLVKNLVDERWERRYFSHIENKKYYCYCMGLTQWTSTGKISPWIHCRKPTPEELGE